MLLEAIMSIELQDLPRHEYELIIVDNSDDLQARDQFRDGLQITCAHRYLDEARPGLSRARNIGINAARAALVAFLDDDAKARAGWLRHISRLSRMKRRAWSAARCGRSGRRAPSLADASAAELSDDNRSGRRGAPIGWGGMAIRHKYRIPRPGGY